MIRPRRVKWTGYVTRMAEKIHSYRTFKGKFYGKRQLGRLRA
jgi:hypothetical protein